VDEDRDAREEEYEGILLLSLRRASSPAGERVCVVVAGAEPLVLPPPGLLVALVPVMVILLVIGAGSLVTTSRCLCICDRRANTWRDAEPK